MQRKFSQQGGARRRDILAVALIAALLFAILAVAGEIAILNGLAAIAALCGLAALYYLIAISTHQARAPEERATSAIPLETSKQTETSMVELLHDPVLVIGPGGRIERANAAARGFLGLARDQGNIASVIRQPQVLEAINVALAGDSPEPVEYSSVAPYESHVRVFIDPLPASPGETRLAMVLLHDETAIRRAERMRADFLANASHELRTPLASLSGFIETLKGHAKEDAGARERFLGIMEAQTERMRRLINDLLSLSRIEMNEHLPPSGEVDLGKVCRDVSDALRPIAADREVTLVLDVAPGPVTVTGDRDELTAVVQNLADNAVKYSPRGAEVRIEAFETASPFEAIRPAERLIADSGRMTIVSPAADGPAGFVRVRDSGPGIERSHLPRLAQRFYRVEEGKSEDRKGTGLGLAIVKHVATRHRGGFSVESAPGGGTVFAMCVPAARNRNEAEALDAQDRTVDNAAQAAD